MGLTVQRSREEGDGTSILAWEVLWCPVVFVRGLLTPALTGVTRLGDRHLSSVAFTSSLQALVGWTRSGWRSCLDG
jgi:hypothetical protein